MGVGFTGTFSSGLYGGSSSDPRDSFDDACPAGQALTGLAGRLVMFFRIQAMGGQCGTVSLVRSVATPYVYTIDVAPVGSLPMRGSNPVGTPYSIGCPANHVVTGIDGASTAFNVAAIRLRCTRFGLMGSRGSYALAEISTSYTFSVDAGVSSASPYSFACPANAVANVLFGSAFQELYGVGISCTTMSLAIR